MRWTRWVASPAYTWTLILGLRREYHPIPKLFFHEQGRFVQFLYSSSTPISSISTASMEHDDRWPPRILVTDLYLRPYGFLLMSLTSFFSSVLFFLTKLLFRSLVFCKNKGYLILASSVEVWGSFFVEFSFQPSISTGGLLLDSLRIQSQLFCWDLFAPHLPMSIFPKSQILFFFSKSVFFLFKIKVTVAPVMHSPLLVLLKVPIS